MLKITDPSPFSKSMAKFFTIFSRPASTTTSHYITSTTTTNTDSGTHESRGTHISGRITDVSGQQPITRPHLPEAPPTFLTSSAPPTLWRHKSTDFNFMNWFFQISIFEYFFQKILYFSKNFFFYVLLYSWGFHFLIQFQILFRFEAHPSLTERHKWIFVLRC